MSQDNTTTKETIEKLTPIEKKILLECGKEHISVKKNI
jgi:hypothetical protein